MVVVARWLLLLGRRGGSKAVGVRKIGLRLGSPRGIEVEVPERQYELQRQREQRQPRTRPDVLPEPLHGITDVII